MGVNRLFSLTINVWFLLVLFATSKISTTTKHTLSLQNLNPQEEIQIVEILKELDVYQRKTIAFRKNELPDYILGAAYVHFLDCYVELSPLIFTESYQHLFKSTIYHEVGHCFGLDHSDDKYSVMYLETNGYIEPNWKEFISQLQSCF